VATKPIGIYHEHPDWFRPLFLELDRRGTNYERIDATHHRFDPSSDADTRFALVFNRMSPSAYLRGRAHNILYTQHYLGHLEQLGVRVINGATAFRNETSKALQLSLLRSLGLPFPAARHQSPVAGAGGRPGSPLPHRRQGEHRRQRRGHRPLRRAGVLAARRR
jgi:hypothetical protein